MCNSFFSFVFFLLESMKELESEKLSLQSEAEQYTDQVSDSISAILLFNYMSCIHLHFELIFRFNSILCVQVQRLQQKLQIMTEMYQENELKLHRYNTVTWTCLSPAVALGQLGF